MGKPLYAGLNGLNECWVWVRVRVWYTFLKALVAFRAKARCTTNRMKKMTAMMIANTGQKVNKDEIDDELEEEAGGP